MDAAPATRAVCRLGLRVGSFIPGGSGASLLEWASAVARAAERSGFDALWVADRSAPGTDGRPAGAGVGYEAYSLLGALAVRTHSLRLGALPDRSDLRWPAVVAKLVTTVDVLSDGRGVVTLGVAGPAGAGDTDGGDGGDGGDGEGLAERLQICRSVLDDDVPRFEGRTYAVHGAVNRPRPVQSGGVPLVVATGPKEPDHRTLAAVSAHADALIVEGDDHAIATVRAGLGDQRTPPGRRPFEVLWTAQHLPTPVTPPQLADRLWRRLEAGATGCIVDLSGPDLVDAVERFGPVLRQAVDRSPTAGSAVD